MVGKRPFAVRAERMRDVPAAGIALGRGHRLHLKDLSQRSAVVGAVSVEVHGQRDVEERRTETLASKNRGVVVARVHKDPAGCRWAPRFLRLPAWRHRS